MAEQPKKPEIDYSFTPAHTPAQPAPSAPAPAAAQAAQPVLYLTEQEEARERLKASIDVLTQQASLQVQMQKEPLKMLGGASAVGAVVGLIAGRQFKRTKKVYVDAGSPAKHQKALMKAQKKQGGQSMGGALVATLGTLAFKTVMDKVVTPKLEEVASTLLDKAGQPSGSKPTAPAGSLPRAASAMAPAASAGAAGAVSSTASPVSTGGVGSFVKPAHKGVVPLPESHVEAKAQGTPIAEAEKANPNAH